MGQFGLRSGPLFKIRLRQGKLFCLQGAQWLELIPLSEREFVVDRSGFSITFETAVDGSVPGFTLTFGGGRRVRGERVDPASLRDSLREFDGRYYSPELDTSYTLELRGHQLMVLHPRHPDMELVRTRKDRFAGNQWFLRQVLFERDESGAVTGFRAGGGRVRNLLFERAGRQVAESVLRRF